VPDMERMTLFSVIEAFVLEGRSSVPLKTHW